MSGGFEVGLWALLILATATDLIWGKIFNWIVLSFLVAGLVFGIWSKGFDQATTSALAIVVAFSLFFPLYLVKALAAGDVKLLMAVAAWANFRFVLELGFTGILIGAVVGTLLLAHTKGIRGAWDSVRAHYKRTVVPVKSHRIPFAPAFLCAFILMHVMERYHWSVI